MNGPGERVWQDQSSVNGEDLAVRTRALVEQAWMAISGATGGGTALEVGGTGGQLPSRFPVEETAVACVGAALLAAAGLHQSRGGTVGTAYVDRGQVAAAVRSERFFEVEGRETRLGFASLSRFFEANDGWVRTHANYPWHKQALLTSLGSADDLKEVGRAVGRRTALEVENAVVKAGGVAAAVRSPDEWGRHAQGLAVAAEPLVTPRRLGDATPRRRPEGPAPASGVRVLDLTRVIAGPAATRFLGALGADVLRIDPPQLPDLTPGAPADSLLAKRTAWLDATSPSGRAGLHGLLDGADVLVCGYRPGALDRLGLDARYLASAYPGLVVVVLSGWGHSGPWAGRRGFDSIVQAASGIAHVESGGETTPGVLPCQLLDHGTGYLMAAATLDGLRCQGELGGTQFRYLSLARTASWLLSSVVSVRGPDRGRSGAAGPDPVSPVTAAAEFSAEPWLVKLDSEAGPVHVVGPPGRLGEQCLRWPTRVSGYGDDEPIWLPR
jgi:crotonobetainyl-CoA:carnitine CoA-transferase CaiB-like acyl-CoA transferase